MLNKTISCLNLFILNRSGSTLVRNSRKGSTTRWKEFITHFFYPGEVGSRQVGTIDERYQDQLSQQDERMEIDSEPGPSSSAEEAPAVKEEL